jgi:hypothetical protein
MPFIPENFKSISKIEGYGGFRGISIGVDCSVAGIETTEEEQNMICSHVNEIYKKLYFLREKNHPESITANKDSIEKLKACFPCVIYAEIAPNEYWGSSRPNDDWLIVTTNRGRIKIGWRKRVINIDWSGSEVTAYSAELFPGEDVTKGERYIHAWGYEKAKEYIAKILSSEN